MPIIGFPFRERNCPFCLNVDPSLDRPTTYVRETRTQSMNTEQHDRNIHLFVKSLQVQGLNFSELNYLEY